MKRKDQKKGAAERKGELQAKLASNQAVLEEAKKSLAATVGANNVSKPSNKPLETVAKTKVTAPATPATPAAPATPAKPATAGKRVSHLKLGPELLARNATPDEIKKAFTDSFNSRGITDQAWIDGRTKIYMNIARKKAQLVKTAAKAESAA